MTLRSACRELILETIFGALALLLLSQLLTRPRTVWITGFLAVTIANIAVKALILGIRRFRDYLWIRRNLRIDPRRDWPDVPRRSVS